jgi:hypothetical protein
MKRSLFLTVAVVALAAGLAVTYPISPAAARVVAPKPTKKAASGRAPRSAAKARRVLVADARKLAGDFAHKHYRSVCSDLTAGERRKLGGTQGCILRVGVLNSLTPVKRFTLIKATINRRRTRAAVSVRINGGNKRVLKGVFRWEGGKYRLDHQTGA